MSHVFFSQTYQEAKSKFLSLSYALKETYPNLVLGNESINSKDSIDYLLVPGTTDTIKVISSGVHGIEGFYGSMGILSVMNELKNYPQKDSFLFIHIINPFGMKNYQKNNENNVDLNRNFIVNHWKRINGKRVFFPLNRNS